VERPPATRREKPSSEEEVALRDSGQAIGEWLVARGGEAEESDPREKPQGSGTRPALHEEDAGRRVAVRAMSLISG